MKRIISYVVLCALCLAGLCPAWAVSPETDSPDTSEAPFAQNLATGEIVYLGMDKDMAEAITGAPLEEGRIGKNKYVYDGITLAFRDDRVVFIEVPYGEARWAANGVVTSSMPTDQALDAMGMSFDAEYKSYYDLYYFEDGARTLDRDAYEESRDDIQWLLSLMTDKQTTIRPLG